MGNKNKTKDRRGYGQFMGIPHVVLEHSDYIDLSTKAKALFVEIAYQYNGHNNGDMTVAFKILKKRGWKRNATISAAVKELLGANLIIKTREGRFQHPFSRCALYALTWQSIDDFSDKGLEVSPTATAPRKFSLERCQKKHPLLKT
ncbi:MAG: hypothetical protein ACI90U_003162 [Pseudomonadales bacterium]|jgi:hypothetical protein